MDVQQVAVLIRSFARTDDSNLRGVATRQHCVDVTGDRSSKIGAIHLVVVDASHACLVEAHVYPVRRIARPSHWEGMSAIKNASGFALVWSLSKIAHRVRFERSASIPRTGPVIIVANHLSVTDPLTLARLVIGHRRFPHFLAMRAVFDSRISGPLARVTGQIPVDRGTSAAAYALEGAAARLDMGQVVVLYPEGSLTTREDGMPGPAKTGAARLALRYPDVPLIPVGMWGAKRGLAHLAHRHRVQLVVGTRLDCVGEPAELTHSMMETIVVLVNKARYGGSR